MSELATPHYIVIGAGAVGGTMGVLLARSGRAVTLVGRPALVEALDRQAGIRFIEAGRESLVPMTAVTAPGEVELRGRPVLLFTVKAGDLTDALSAARARFPAETLAVTWQNGIRAEAMASPIFPNLLGGIVRATSTMLEPGELRIRAAGVLIAGRNDRRAEPADDPERDALVADLRGAGYDAVISPDLASDKALKLLVNLFSGASPLVRLDGRPAPELTRVECNVLIEGAHVLTTAGVPYRARASRGDSVGTMLEHLRNRQPRALSNDQVYNSTWQNLHTPGRRLENEFMNGEIVSLAREQGVAAPWNRRLLELLEETQARQAGPGAFTDAEFGRRFADLAEPPPLAPAES